MSTLSPSTLDTQTLRHRIRILELERDQHKLRAKRLALMLAHAERQNKMLRQEAGHA